MSDNFANNDNMVSIMTATGLKIKERAKIFYGTETEWNALTVDQKKEYDYWASPETSEGNAVPEGGSTGQVLAKVSNDDFDMNWQSLGTAAGKDFTDTIRPNSHDLAESGACYSAINNALSSIYTPRGDLTCAELTSSLLVAANVGNVYSMTDAGTTSALFINGAGYTISVGDNVGIIKAGQNDIMFNLMGNAFDLHNYQKKDLDTPLTIVGQSNDDVEGSLGRMTSLLNYLSTNGGFNVKQLPFVPYSDLDPTHTTTTYLKKYMEYCVNNGYITSRDQFYWGYANPNSNGLVIVFSYGGTQALQYMSGIYMSYGELIWFGFANNSWFCRNISYT